MIFEQNNCFLYSGNCLDIIKNNISDNSIDLIITSPPYAKQREKTYGGISNDKYVEWFLPISKELLRVLKPTGTFILNIKENVINCERSTYVLELILEMRKQGWLWTEEFIWHKTSCFPGKWKNRFRDAWERLLQFNKNKDFYMYQDEVKVPIGDWADKRLKKLGDNDTKRKESDTESGFGKNISNWIGKEMVYPSNVLTFAAETKDKGHSAVFPKKLPGWFIRLFSKQGDIVMDPFVGSGTTIFSCLEQNRKSVGIDINEEYIEKIKEKLCY